MDPMAASSKSEKKPNPSAGDIGDHLECCICHEVIHNCLSIQPCLHNYCAGCLSQWMECSEECPQCRVKINSTAENRTINGIVEAYLKDHPDKVRETEDLRALDRAAEQYAASRDTSSRARRRGFQEHRAEGRQRIDFYNQPQSSHARARNNTPRRSRSPLSDQVHSSGSQQHEGRPGQSRTQHGQETISNENQRQLDARQRELDRQQRDVSQQQLQLGRQQGELGVQQGELGLQQASVALNQRSSCNQRQQISSRQQQLGERQRHLAEQQLLLGERQTELSRMQAELNVQQNSIPDRPQQSDTSTHYRSRSRSSSRHLRRSSPFPGRSSSYQREHTPSSTHSSSESSAQYGQDDVHETWAAAWQDANDGLEDGNHHDDYNDNDGDDADYNQDYLNEEWSNDWNEDYNDWESNNHDDDDDTWNNDWYNDSWRDAWRNWTDENGVYNVTIHDGARVQISEAGISIQEDDDEDYNYD